MIFIPRLPVPHAFEEKAQRATAELLNAISDTVDVRRLLDFRRLLERQSAVWRSARPHLEEMFHGKCAYCESYLRVVAHADIVHYRPKSGVSENDGNFPTHYAWLAFTWDNLLVSCQICNRYGKARRFPIHGVRAPIGGFGTQLSAEEPILLNPCEDQPQYHLRFAEDGTVHGTTDRGTTTINVLDLNRTDLVKARRVRAEEVLNLAEMIRSFALSSPTGLAPLLKNLRDMLADSGEYAALARNLAETYLTGLFQSMGRASAHSAASW